MKKASMHDRLLSRFHAAFDSALLIIARAPGRIEFIGNHTDYNGGTVLGAAIDRGIWVGLSPRSDGRRRFGADYTSEIWELPVGRIEKQAGAGAWLNYPLGVLAALPEFGLRPPAGFDLFVVSDLPVGAGLSSSAALELACALAFLAATGQEIERERLVGIGRHAENHFVGVPCGILDQGVSAFGKRDHLVFIDCGVSKFERVPLPAEGRFWIFNTHSKHALVDGLYEERHQECMEAARLLGVSQLAALSPEELDLRIARLPELSSAIARRARHVVEENARVAAVCRALEARDLRAAGECLTASHHSSRTLFENSTPELDFLVETLCAQRGIYGARLTGGGFGGAVMALADEHFSSAQAEEIASAYRGKFSGELEILHTSTGDGAALVG